jgi:hypothetical protein
MKKGDLFPLASPYSVIGSRRDVRVKYTGEKRPPKKGEYYLSGAIVEGYLAPSDLSYPCHIGTLVRVRLVEVEEGPITYEQYKGGK